MRVQGGGIIFCRTIGRQGEGVLPSSEQPLARSYPAPVPQSRQADSAQRSPIIGSRLTSAIGGGSRQVDSVEFCREFGANQNNRTRVRSCPAPVHQSLEVDFRSAKGGGSRQVGSVELCEGLGGNRFSSANRRVRRETPRPYDPSTADCDFGGNRFSSAKRKVQREYIHFSEAKGEEENPQRFGARFSVNW